MPEFSQNVDVARNYLCQVTFTGNFFSLTRKKKLLEQLGIKPGSGCSNVGQRYPPDKSLSNGCAIGKSIVLSTFRRTGPCCFMTFSLTLPNGWLTLWYYVLLDYVMTNIVCEQQSVGNHKYHWTLLYVRWNTLKIDRFYDLFSPRMKAGRNNRWSE